MNRALALLGLACLTAALVFSAYLGSLRQRVDELERRDTYTCRTLPDDARTCKAVGP